MYSRLNPPKPTTHMQKIKVVRQLYDFAYDKNHNLTVVKGEKVCFDAMAAAAAEQSDFKILKEQLRSGGVKVTREMLDTPPAGAQYGEDFGAPENLIELNDAINAKAAEIKKSYETIPEDLRNGLTLAQFEKFISDEKIKNYVSTKESKKEVVTKEPKKEAVTNE